MRPEDEESPWTFDSESVESLHVVCHILERAVCTQIHLCISHPTLRVWGYSTDRVGGIVPPALFYPLSPLYDSIVSCYF